MLLKPLLLDVFFCFLYIQLKFTKRKGQYKTRYPTVEYPTSEALHIKLNKTKNKQTKVCDEDKINCQISNDEASNLSDDLRKVIVFFRIEVLTSAL